MENFTKHPRIFHLPWSPGISDDDRVLPSADVFKGRHVVVTAKMDGENTTLYRNGLHARSLDSTPHPSQDWVRALQGRIAHDIPPTMRICGENLYAKHSIAYQHLTSFFLVFGIWLDDVCVSWDETVLYAAILDLPLVPVLYRGRWNEKAIRELHNETLDGDPCEGYVVRSLAGFSYDEFNSNVAKYVRKDHVQRDVHHWRSAPVTPNKLR